MGLLLLVSSHHTSILTIRERGVGGAGMRGDNFSSCLPRLAWSRARLLRTKHFIVTRREVWRLLSFEAYYCTLKRWPCVGVIEEQLLINKINEKKHTRRKNLDKSTSLHAEKSITVFLSWCHKKPAFRARSTLWFICAANSVNLPLCANVGTQN